MRRLPRRRREGRRARGRVHAAPSPGLHRRRVPGPHHRERPTAHRRRPDALDRRRAVRHGDAGLEDPAVGRRAARRAGVPQDVFFFLRRHHAAAGGARLRARARHRRAQRPPVLRLDRLPQVPRRSGPRRRTFRADAQGRCRFPDLRRRPRAELALQRRRRRRRDLPPSAHRTRRHADAVVQRLDRPEVPDRRRAVASGAVRALPVAAPAPGAARRDPRRRGAGDTAGRAGRLGVESRRALVVPARRAGDSQEPLVHAGDRGRVGAGAARRARACPAHHLGRPLAEPGQPVAAVHAAAARQRRQRRLDAACRRVVARPADRAVPDEDPRGDGAPLLPDGRGHAAGVSVALDQRAAAGDRGARPWHRAFRFAPCGVGTGGASGV